MEVPSCSGVHFIGESEYPHKGSATSFTNNGESNCLEHGEQAQMADVKLDDVVPIEEGPLKDRLHGGRWTVDELPISEDHLDGESFYELEVDDQKVVCDSIDSEDDVSNTQDQCLGPSLASQLSVETIESGLPSSNREGEALEPKWLEQDEPMSVWVKWRGKWQAGIKCARVDWPLSTLKAKPTHGRKKYIVIFFPRTRNYSWADVLLVRPINEYPQPIAYRTHKVGVKLVNDLTLAHRFIMQKLAVSMLNIIDQLQNEALIEAARNVTIWKEFGMEASRCNGYSDLGRMLLKLQNMVLPRCLHSYWVENSLMSWVQQCQNARTAESIEMLKEELVDSILWNDVNSLSNVAAQPELGSEWKTWKQEVMKWFSMTHAISGGEDSERKSSDVTLELGSQISRKRPKLEVRRADVHSSHAETQALPQAISFETDSAFLPGRESTTATTLESGNFGEELPVAGIMKVDPPISAADKWGDIVVEAENSEVIPTKGMELTVVNEMVAKKPLGNSNKNRQCIAFIEAKGRQCVRWANDGDVYCCVHLASRFVGNAAKAEASPVDAAMCEGTTVLGTKCKHRSLYGSSFCKKHRPQNDSKVAFITPENKLKRKHEESLNRSESTSCREIVLVGEVETPLQVDPISVIGGEGFNANSLVVLPEQPGKEYDGTERLYCIGSCSQDGSDPCPESPKRHSLYCEKHLPSWLKRARNGKSRIVSKDVFMDLLKDCYCREQKLHLHQACELFYRLFKSVLSLRNPVPKEIQLQWAISEASKDLSVGGFLMKLVHSEKERLNRLWGFDSDKNTQVSSTLKKVASIPVASDGDLDNKNVIRCKICSEKFLDDQVLGAHWMENHKKEAQWLFRGYVCAICLDSFTNKKVLEAHVQERHRVQFVEQCMLFQCIPCGGHFGNPEQLWLHVLSVHPADFRVPNTAQQQILYVAEDCSERLEPMNSASAENTNCESQGGVRKFVCRFCGLKFDLLPDLGRHHQAAHMGATSVGPRPPKRGIRYYAYRLKSGRLSRPKFKKGLGGSSYSIRNRGSLTIKKRIQASDSVGNGDIKVLSNVTETATLGRLAESECAAVANILFSEVKKTKSRPSNSDILLVARSSCCKLKLQSALEEEFGLLPEHLYLKAAKLCSEHNILVDWHQEGFICPKGCMPFLDPYQLSPLVPLPNGVARPRSFPSDPVVSEWTMDECHCVIDFQHFQQEPVQKAIILCDDISFGQESVPIACVVDENLLGSLHIHADGSDGQITDSMPWESFTYVMKPLLDQSVRLETKSLQLACACTHMTCSSEVCDHVYLFDNDYEDAKDIYGKPMHGRFAYDEKGRIILEEGYLVYECNQKCSCSRNCPNRVLQNGVQVKLEVFKTDDKGWAVRAGEAILRGTFVCEYIGEVVDEEEARKRRNRYGDGEGCNYFYDIDAHINDMSRLIEGQVPYVIDTTNYANISRFINHSCSPNLMNHQVLVESMDYQLAHIGLYASRDIAAGEELTYDYRYKLLPGEGFLCQCGASNCRGRLY